MTPMCVSDVSKCQECLWAAQLPSIALVLGQRKPPMLCWVQIKKSSNYPKCDNINMDILYPIIQLSYIIVSIDGYLNYQKKSCNIKSQINGESLQHVFVSGHACAIPGCSQETSRYSKASWPKLVTFRNFEAEKTPILTQPKAVIGCYRWYYNTL